MAPIPNGLAALSHYWCCDIYLSHTEQLCGEQFQSSVCAFWCVCVGLYCRTISKEWPDYWTICRSLCIFIAELQVASQKSQQAICLSDRLVYMEVNNRCDWTVALTKVPSKILFLRHGLSGCSPWRLDLLILKSWLYCTCLDGQTCPIFFPILQACRDLLRVWRSLVSSKCTCTW